MRDGRCELVSRNGNPFKSLLACEHDLEGMVAKHKFSPYSMDRAETSWVKVKNLRYSQMYGRDELFKRRNERAEQMQTVDGWAGCTLRCAEAEF